MPAPSWEETNDGFCHRRKTTHALEQVHEASSWCAAAKVNAVTHPLSNSGEEDLPVKTMKGSPPGGVLCHGRDGHPTWVSWPLENVVKGSKRGSKVSRWVLVLSRSS